MFLVQRAFTYEWVTVSTHDTREEAEDAVLILMDPERPDTVRVIPGVSLAKETDDVPPSSPYDNRPWRDTVKLYLCLTSVFGDSRGDALYSGLAANDLGVLRYTLRHWFRYDNTTGELVF